MNEYSQRFYPYAKQILRTYEEATAGLKEMQAADKTFVTVSYNPLLGQYGAVDISPTVRTYLYLLYPRHITASCAKDFLHYMADCRNK